MGKHSEVFVAFDVAKKKHPVAIAEGRNLTSHKNPRQLGALRDLSAQAFDVLAAVLFQKEDRVLRAALIPRLRVVELAKRVERTNSWRFLLRDAIWAVSGVRDVTADLQRAEASWALALTEDSKASNSRSITNRECWFVIEREDGYKEG